MSKNTKKQQRRTARKGSAAPAEVIVGDKSRHAAIVDIQNHGRDERGTVLGTNGIRWVVPA